jgi:hypothetical protein
MTPPRSALERRLGGLVASIQSGDCVLVLGPRIAAPAELAGEGVCLADDLAAKLMEDLGGTDDPQPGLRRAIARYERERSPQACRTLIQQIVGEYQGHTTPLHADLAALPFRLALCATPDTLMFEAFRQAGKPGTVGAHYDHHPGLGGVPPLALPTADRPIVYSLFGRHDHPESMVLNDQNLLDYLVSVTKENPALPDAVRATLRAPATVFLFVGFGFENWWLRLLLKVLKITGVDNRGMSIALEDSRAFEDGSLAENKGFFESAGIYIQPGDWNDLARSLRERVVVAPAARLPVMAGAAGTAPDDGAARPLVFLSYASEDMATVNWMRAGLVARGLEVWQDKTHLRGGQRWMDQIKAVIERVDFFVFVQTEQMDRRDGFGPDGIYNEELALALQRKRLPRPGCTFVVPVTVGTCRKRPERELRELHRIPVDDEAGLDRLAADLLAAMQEAPAA